jgi:hypothetical protein
MAKLLCGLILTAVFLIPANAQRTGKLQVQVQKSGKVTMEDGSPPPEPVVVEALCGAAAAVPVARTDSKGGFIIGHGRDADVDARMQRGSASSASGRNLAGCALQARLPGYRSSQLHVADSEAIDLGVIVMRRVAGEGVTESATSLQASKDARRAFETAITMAPNQAELYVAFARFDFATAEPEHGLTALHAAVSLDRTNQEALSELRSVYRRVDPQGCGVTADLLSLRRSSCEPVQQYRCAGYRMVAQYAAAVPITLQIANQARKAAVVAGCPAASPAGAQ